MSDSNPNFDLQTKLAHANRANARMAEDLNIARMTIENYKLREITLEERVTRAESETRKVKQEAVHKAAEIVEAQFDKDLREFCAQIGIEPQGSESLSPSQRVAATMAFMAADTIRLEALIELGDEESKESRWMSTLEYDNNQEGAMIRNGDGEIVADAYVLVPDPGDVDPQLVVRMQFRAALDKLAKLSAEKKAKVTTAQ